MRLLLLAVVGLLAIAIVSPVGALRNGSPPRPRKCHGTRDCARHRYELFAVTFKATQRHVWTLPAGQGGVVNGCARGVSGAGEMTLSFEAPRPTYALVAHSFASPIVYWHSPGGGRIGGFDVRSSLEGFGWLRYDWAPLDPVEPACNPHQVHVGSLDPGYCRSNTVIQMLLAEEEHRDGWLEGADASKGHGMPSSRCPTASYTDLLPILLPGGFGAQELRLLRKTANYEPYASRLSSRRLFNCRVQTLTSVLDGVRRETEGPVDAWRGDDPNSPSWPHWHMTTTMQWKFTFKRVGCGKGR
jgi:hypothetical protein